jgi:hypothetical protein
MLLSFKPLELKYWLTEEDLQKIIKEDWYGWWSKENWSS